MAQRKTNATKNTRTRSSSRPKTRVISGRGSRLQRLQAFLARRPILALAVIVFGLVGTYLLVTGYALPGMRGVPPDNEARGLIYRGLKKASSGPCEGEFIAERASETAKDIVCMHVDPGPPDVDLRQRAKAIERELQEQAAYDEKYLTDEPETTVAEGTPELVTDAGKIAGRSLGEIAGRNWSCPGTGADGKRVEWLYVYKSGSMNRLKEVRSSLVSIAKRTNAVIYNSSQASGNKAQHIRYLTSSDCKLRIAAVAVTGDLNSTSNLKSQLQAKGYNSTNRKYLISVDGGSACGVGERYADDRASTTNYNNSGPMYAYSWKPCWNYAEPHELGHTLGAVQRSAPRSTGGGHCHDEKDVMCYNDGTADSGKLSNVCTSNTKHWMMDCNFNDYYDRGATSGYIANYWNTANNGFLTGN